MVGKNKLVLNDDTMREAIQHWLNDSQLKHGERVKVLKVSRYRSGGWAVEFDGKIPKPPAPGGAA